MTKATLFFGKNSKIARVFTAIAIISIIVPNAMLISLPTVIAQEVTESSAATVSDSSSSDASDTPAASISEDTSSATVETTTEDPAAPTVTADPTVPTTPTTSDTGVVLTTDETTVTPDTTDTIPTTDGTNPTTPTTGGSSGSSSGSDTSERGFDLPPAEPGVLDGTVSTLGAAATGSIRICQMFVDTNGNVATSPAHLPAGTFTVHLTDPSGAEITHSGMHINTQAFAPNASILNGQDAMCATYSGLSLTNSTMRTYSGFYYDQASLFAGVSSYWQPTLYNDGSTIDVHSMGDLFLYDGPTRTGANGNSDGFISLSAARPDRTLVIVNKAKENLVLPCVAGSVLTQDEFFNAIYSGFIDRSISPLTDRIHLDASSTSATFHIENRTGCTAPISFASYKMFDQKLESQQLFDSTSVVNAGAVADITVRLPDCMAQVDAYTGPAATHFNANDNFLYPNNPFILAAAFHLNNSDSIAHASGAFCTPSNGNQAPVLTLLGDNPMTVIVGSTFTDPGATATDTEDGDITSRITVSTAVINTNILGTQTITYTVVDSGGLTDTETRTINVVSVTPPPPACAIPNSNGDVTAETINTSNGETTLQDMLNTAGFSINTLTDQQNYQTWNASANTVTAKVQYINGITSLEGVFGYYVAGDISSFVPVFSTQANTLYPHAPVITPGQDVSFSIPAGQNIAYAIASEAPTSGNVFFSMSENALNGGADKMIAYHATGTSNYVLAFEDNPTGGSDNDYNDLVVRVEVTSCGGGSGPGNHAPVLTLLGDNPMNIEIGSTYTEPGATALDAEDGDITSQVTLSSTGPIDTSAVATFSRTYTVVDSGGLSDTKTRVINVIQPGTNGGGGGGHHGSSGGRAGQVLGAETGPTSCVYLNDYLRRDWTNNPVEVLKLQLFLKNLEGHSDLQATGVFDDATFAAVSSFQDKYFDDILAPWGHTAPTGFVYILTKKKVNEIFCQTAFPVSPLQAKEISDFKAFVNSLKANGITIPSTTTDTNTPVFNPETDMPADGVVGSAATSTIAVGSNNNFKKLGDVKAVAAAVFSIPKDKGMLLQSLYFLLIAIIAVYLFTEIIVGSRDTSRLTKYQVWSRKATGYTIGLIVAIVAALWYSVFSIVLPLIVLTVISGIFLIWTITKRPRVEETETIILPPRQ